MSVSVDPWASRVSIRSSVIGAYYDDDNTGSAYVYFGGAGGFSTTPSILTGPAGPGRWLGSFVASTGDVDGFADILIDASGVNGFAGAEDRRSKGHRSAKGAHERRQIGRAHV